ncbi:hypothetical protein [Flavobacterium marginilacus]|uniref:hypothetical protein n=1 Tax=Flavobacterium marginilacus TaxID=3003256 RepID=UPI00248F2F36|nr:hypothetical protein [Flavobacterium marginilacus]
MNENSKLSEYVKLFEILSIVGAATWTIFMYKSYEERTNELNLKQQELLYKQAKLTSEADVSTKKTNAELLKLNYNIQKSTASFEIEKVKLLNKQSELENNLKTAELGFLNQKTISSKVSDSIIKLNTAPKNWIDFYAFLELKLKNTSKNTINIYQVDVITYLGKLITEPEYEHSILMNNPHRKGAIEWHFDNGRQYYSIEECQKLEKQGINCSSLIGGFAFGRLQSGESSSANATT